MKGDKRIDSKKFPELIEFAKGLGFGIDFPTCVTDNKHFLALADVTCTLSVEYDDETIGINPYNTAYIRVVGHNKLDSNQAKAFERALPNGIKILERLEKEMRIE